MNVTLRQLRAYTTVAELGSFVDAARSMHITASALSLQVSELEQTLGFRVFERTTRRLKLSVAGRQYLPYARRVLNDLESAHRCAIELRLQKTGIVRIAATQTLTWMLMPPVFSAFRGMRPDIRIEPLDLPVDQVLREVDEGNADLAITVRSNTEYALQTEPLFTSRLQFVCRSDHKWAHRKRLRWSDLESELLILTGSDTPQRLNASLPSGPRLEAAWQTSHSGTSVALVASGFGSAICASYLQPMIDMHKLRMIPLFEPVLSREILLYSSRTQAMTPAVETFRDFLVKYFSQSGDPSVSS